GPWMMKVAGRLVLVCLAGSRLVGLEPQTGEPAWQPIDMGFVPEGTPGFADLDGDGQPDIVLRGPGESAPGDTGATSDSGELLLGTARQRSVRAVTLPAGKMLWSHPLPQKLGWVGHNAGSGFLREPLLIDLDGDGKPLVIVPDEQGTIAVLDGLRGQM